MTKRMLVDATHPEETRVAIVDGTQLSDFDFERASRKQLKGNIYLAKVIRIEPSLQAAFVEYGGNRHGFLPFSEIHPDYFRIPVGDRPQDEEGDEGENTGTDTDDEDNATTDDVLQAYRDDADYAQHDHGHGDQAAENIEIKTDALIPAPVAETAASEILVTPAPSGDIVGVDAPPASNPLAEFSAPHDELGLITDFGNAMVPPADAPVEPVPLETVGGEVAEEEEPRFRRQPRPRYKIQEVVKRRQVMLIQVVKEERGNKGAALTTFLSLAGRYCVLMPNTDHGGGVSRKITNHQDRRRMKEILDQLEIPEGMAVILRTAGMEKEPPEIQRDLEYLLRLWNNIREQTLQSTAPALIYEEANLIKRSVRDLYADDLEEILVSGKQGHQTAVDFMRTLLPDQVERVRLYEDSVPLFFRYNVEKQIDQLYTPTVHLRSGGYIVINPTEALVSIDVNSGRSTRERHIEGTALKTNLEAADEIARQLRLRDLAGLVVIDFIDMEDGRNNAAVERRLKEAMKADRARLQIGRISPFGLLELSRQRLHPSLMEINFEKCPHCAGMGLVRSIDSAAISILRMIEEEGIRQGSSEIILHVPTKVALYILNQKRTVLSEIERRYNIQVLLHSDDTLVAPDCRLERVRGGKDNRDRAPVADADSAAPRPAQDADESESAEQAGSAGSSPDAQPYNGDNNNRRGGRGRMFGRNRSNRNQRDNRNQNTTPSSPAPTDDNVGNTIPDQPDVDDNIGNSVDGATSTNERDNEQRRGRRRGRRGGRGRRNGFERGPRDQQAQGGDRYQPQQGDTNGNASYAPAQPSSAPQPSHHVPHVPTSIHDLDTTPREASQQDRPYQVVESSGDRPKGGWWHRLTGQS